ncbi:hypothetical protein J3A83DRAFT_4194292 [Scleroderma citrinum]
MKPKALCEQESTSINLIKLWDRVDTSVSHGHNSLVCLVVCLLSIVTNSARCEWAFSEFRVTHTKQQNYLLEEKVHKTMMVKMDLQKDQAEAGLLPPQKQWQFSDFKSSVHADQPPSLMLTPAEVAETETDMIHKIVATDLPGPVVQDLSAFESNSSPVLIPLKDIFNFSISLDMDYWIGGFRALEDEAACYDLSASTALVF